MTTILKGSRHSKETYRNHLQIDPDLYWSITSIMTWWLVECWATKGILGSWSDHTRTRSSLAVVVGHRSRRSLSLRAAG